MLKGKTTATKTAATKNIACHMALVLRDPGHAPVDLVKLVSITPSTVTFCTPDIPHPGNPAKFATSSAVMRTINSATVIDRTTKILGTYAELRC